jgi:dihydroflavonol-4-reductase
MRLVDFRSERILITGGTGFLGANLVHFLVNSLGVAPSRVRVFSLAGTPTAALRDLPPLDIRHGDILNAGDIEDACRDRTLVFHAAGVTSFDPRAKRMQWLVNVEGTRNLIDAARKAGSVRRICHTSTVNVLGCPEPAGSVGTAESCSPYSCRRKTHSFASPEDALRFADSVRRGTAPGKWWKRIGIGYHDSKLAAQELVDRAVREEKMDIVSVLPGTCFGPYDTLLGSGLYLSQILASALPGVPKGGCPLVHVGDAARGHVLAMARGKAGAHYVVTGRSEDNMYYADMARIIADVLKEREPGLSIRSSFPTIPAFAAELAAGVIEIFSRISRGPCLLSRDAVRAGSYPSFYSCEKARRELGYVPHRTFRQAVESMYDYMKENGLLAGKSRKMDALVLKLEPF